MAGIIPPSPPPRRYYTRHAVSTAGKRQPCTKLFARRPPKRPRPAPRRNDSGSSVTRHPFEQLAIAAAILEHEDGSGPSLSPPATQISTPTPNPLFPAANVNPLAGQCDSGHAISAFTKFSAPSPIQASSMPVNVEIKPPMPVPSASQLELSVQRTSTASSLAIRSSIQAKNLTPVQLKPRLTPSLQQQQPQPPSEQQLPQNVRSETTPVPPTSASTVGIVDICGRPFGVELYYDFKNFQEAPQTKAAILFCQKYFLEPFMVPRAFYYPRVVQEFYRTMTTKGLARPVDIFFEIDGKQGVLTAQKVAAALGVPLAPLQRSDFSPHSTTSTAEMVKLLSRGKSTSPYAVKRAHLEPNLWLVDHVLRTNIYPCQHLVQRRDEILEGLFQIDQGQWWCPAHLFMAALFYFESKVHVKKLSRAQKFPLFFPRLLCTILEHLGFSAAPEEHKTECRDIFTLSRWHLVSGKAEATSPAVSLSASFEHHYTSPPVLHDDLDGDDSDSPPVVPTPATTTPAAQATTPAHSIPAALSTPVAPNLATPARPSMIETSGALSSAISSHVLIPAFEFSQLCTKVDTLQQYIVDLTRALQQHVPIPVLPAMPVPAVVPLSNTSLPADIAVGPSFPVDALVQTTPIEPISDVAPSDADVQSSSLPTDDVVDLAPHDGQ